MRKDVIVLLILLSITVLSLTVNPALATDEPSASQKPKEDSWTTMAPMPTPRTSFGMAAVDGKIYAIGGNILDEKTVNVTEVYDPTTNQWTTKAPMPTLRYQFATAVYQNKIYCIGGIGADWQYYSTNEVYDPATDTWETRALMPTARSQPDACVVNDKIYLIGGNRQQRNLSILDILNGRRIESPNEVYYPATDNWTTAPPIQYTEITSPGLMPVTYTHATGKSVVLDNQLYWVGRVYSDANWQSRRVTMVFNPESASWTSRAPLPLTFDSNEQNAVSTTGIWAPKGIYFFGANKVTAYDPVTGNWTREKIMLCIGDSASPL